MKDLIFKLEGNQFLTYPKYKDPRIDSIAKQFCHHKGIRLEQLELEDLKTSLGFLYDLNTHNYWQGMWVKATVELDRIVKARTGRK